MIESLFAISTNPTLASFICRMVYIARATLRFDGSAIPNPGKGGAGYIITDDSDGEVIIEGRYCVSGDCTNNVAEYFGLCEGLSKLISSDHTVGKLDIEGDSELVINQMKGVYKVRKPRLYKLYQRAKNLVNRRNRIYDYEFIHISRNRNARADALAREAIEMQSDWDEDYY